MRIACHLKGLSADIVSIHLVRGGGDRTDGAGVGSERNGSGRDGGSNAFYLYVRCPDGHRTEIYTSDYQTMDPDHEPVRWSLHDPKRQTLWGQPAPKSWFEEGSRFAGSQEREAAFKADVVIAN